MTETTDAKRKTITSTGIWKIVFDGLTVELFRNDAFFQSISVVGDNLRFGFNFYRPFANITFKNFRIYTI